MEGKKYVDGPEPVNDKCVSLPRRARISVSLSEFHEGHHCPAIVRHFRVRMSELTETLEEMDVWKNESHLWLLVKIRNWPEKESLMVPSLLEMQLSSNPLPFSFALEVNV